MAKITEITRFLMFCIKNRKNSSVFLMRAYDEKGLQFNDICSYYQYLRAEIDEDTYVTCFPYKFLFTFLKLNKDVKDNNKYSSDYFKIKNEEFYEDYIKIN